jgi:hypothetical protein
MTVILNISRAHWRGPELIDVPVYLEDVTEDALDRECVPLDEIEDQIASAIWEQADHERHDWILGEDEIPVRMPDEAERLELAREGYLVSAYLDERVQ